MGRQACCGAVLKSVARKLRCLVFKTVPIPAFDHNNVLPPHLGDPRVRGDLSPFPATSLEVCERFGGSAERRAILEKWLGFRGQLHALGITTGFQWLDGSFLEDVEATESRAPNDLDVVTFYSMPPGEMALDFLNRIQESLPAFFDRRLSRMAFSLDHFGIHLGSSGAALVDHVRYWSGLFSHRRDGVWKGMLRVDLNTPVEDNTAVSHLSPTT